MRSSACFEPNKSCQTDALPETRVQQTYSGYNAGPGGLPRALGSSTRGLRGFLGSLSKVANLELESSTRVAIDLAFFGAEALDCSMQTQ